MYTIGALAVMLLIVIAFWGFGRAVQRLCAPGAPTDAGTAACVGLGAYLAACGYIELTASASPTLLIGIVASGLVVAALQVPLRDIVARARAVRRAEPGHAESARHGSKPGQFRGRRWQVILGLLLVVYLAFLVNAAWWHFSNNDDVEGYLVLALRILQTGSTGLDPFLFRRVEAGLGGNSYLYALPMALFDFPIAHVADTGVGSVMLALLVRRHAGDVAPGNVRVLTASLTLALLVAVFAPVINLAPDLPAIAIIYAAIRQGRRLSRQPRIRVGEHILFGLLLFALVCLRTSYLVPAFTVAASLYLVMLWTRRDARTILAALAAFLVVAVCAAPWMVVLYRIAGTPYYPLLGFGTMTHAEVAGFTALPTLVKNAGRILLCYPLAVLGLWAVLRTRTATRSEAFLCVLTPLLLALSLLAQAKYTVFGWRYGYVAAATLPLYLFVELLGTTAPPRWHRTLVAAGLAAFAVALLHNESWHPDTMAFGQLYVWATGLPYNPYQQTDATAQRETVRAALRAMQSAVPPGQRLLVRLEDPFLLDFRRNPIWVMDHPGLCGPPPGVPQSATVAAWTPYLKADGVDFVAYDYGNEAGEPAALDQAFLRINGPSYFQERIASAAAAVQAVLMQLRTTDRVIYDDGRRSVMTLAGHRSVQGTGIAAEKASSGSW